MDSTYGNRRNGNTMLNVICMITVTILLPNGGLYPQYRMITKDVRGTILSSNDESYTVDFSKEAQENGYYGEHLAKQKVQKIMCKEIK